MKNLDFRMILLISIPPVFALLLLFLIMTVSPEVYPELSTAFNLLFSPFFLMTFLFMMVFRSLAGVVGIFVIAILCIAVEYYYVKVLLRGQGRERIAMIVATYLLTGLLTGMVILFPLIGQEDPDRVQLTLSKVDRNETSGSLIHLTQQDLEESPALQSLIKSGHTSMSWDEWVSFRQRYSPGSIVEYNVTYYTITRRVPLGG